MGLKQKIRIIIFLLIVGVTLIGFGAKYYRGPCQFWVNNSLAGLFYDVFWCLVLYFILPGVKSYKIAIWVFLITSMLEFLQLWHPPFLQSIRNTFLGAAFLGNSFNWLDFPYYLVGCSMGMILIKILKRKYQDD